MQRGFTSAPLLCTVDSQTVRRYWAARSGQFSPEYYAHYGPNDASEYIRRQFETHLTRDTPILELGCSSGRHLAHLHEHGFENLVGIDVNEDAFAVMADAYPELRKTGSFHNTSIEEVIEEFETDRFGGVFSVQTLQHLHPDACWVFDELARITREVLITVEIEHSIHSEASDPGEVNYVDEECPLYYRDWEAIFTQRGFIELEVKDKDHEKTRVFQAVCD